MKTISRKEIEAAFAAYHKAAPAPHATEEELEEWEPNLTPSQKGMYYDERRYILAHGERGSGKTLAMIHKGIRHCYLYDDALYLLVTITRTGGKLGGAWEDLTSKALFKEGPLAGTPGGVLEMWRHGCGLEYGNYTSGHTATPWSYYRDEEKNLWIDIINVHGGLSRIVFKSMGSGPVVIDRIKDIKPSFFHFEELTNTHDEVYFTEVIQQLGRRRSVPPQVQQYVATCNPANSGQKHWVFNTFFVSPHVLKEGAKAKIETHEFDYKTDIKEYNPAYGVHHIPMQENNFMPGKQSYLDRIMESARSDPTKVDRLIRGLWVPRIAGESLFFGYWERSIHRIGDVIYGLEPIPGEPIIIGYDPGAVNNARVFMQRIWVNKRPIWRIFDCLVYKKKKIYFSLLVKLLMDRMVWWCERYNHRFTFYHISDRQALDQFNPHGSYEYKEYYRKSKEMIAANPKYSRWLSPIRMAAPTKGADSVRDRVRSVRDKLQDETLFVSACGCEPVIEMFEMLRKGKDRMTKAEDDDMPLKATDGHIHTFDALSYPIYYYDIARGASRPPEESQANQNLAFVSSPV